MSTYTPDELSKILDTHRRWLRGEADGARADLTRADLTDANLTHIKADLFDVLASAPNEAAAVLAALEAGRVEGSAYAGECACLVGTIANARGVDCCDLGDLRPNEDRPAERWFLAIHTGDTPATNPVAAISADWVREFLAKQQSEVTADA